MITTLHEAGIHGFDVASPGEIDLVRNAAPDASLLYTHPIKPRSFIVDAYMNYGVNTFVVDCASELAKIKNFVPADSGLIIVRVKTPIFGQSAMQNLDEKFGAPFDLANALLKEAHEVGFRTGVCFHVGFQQLHPNAHWLAVEYLSQVLEIPGFELSFLSIGGGFPASYNLGGQVNFVTIVPNAHEIRKHFPMFSSARIITEPGRSLVANTTSSQVTVIGVDGQRVFIDDGIYSGLMDCGIANMRFPVTHKDRPDAKDVTEFTIFGPTCDSLDVLPGKYFLPSDTAEGDILIVHNTGAYGSALTNNFNGLAPPSTTEIIEGPTIDWKEAS